jgi:3-oxoadipate enol-lactonase
MTLIYLDDIRLNAEVSGPENGPPLVLIHALGTRLEIWDGLLPLIPKGLRVLRMDLRGHGRSDVPAAPYAMGALVRDVERVMDHLRFSDAVVLGLSVGGLIAQGLAIKRLDLVRGLILSNTAARIGTTSQWAARIAGVRAGGVAAVAEATLERWFGRNYGLRPDIGHWRAMLAQMDPEGWCGTAAAIAGTDFYTPTATLRLPTLGLAGDRDGSTPPDLVRETVDLIAGSRFQLIRGGGHLPFVEQPQAYAAAVTGFLQAIGHV